jgi:hypothetical protein
MANLLIGSSNVSRFYTTKQFKAYREYKMIKCTDIDSFKAHMIDIKVNIKCVVISVLENFVEDWVKDRTEEPEEPIVECINDFVETIANTIARLPGTKFGIVLPMGRPARDWYQTRLGDISSKLNLGIGSLVASKTGNNITKIECISAISQQFEHDNVHLTPAAGKAFVDFILGQAEDFFEADLVEVQDDEDGEIESEDEKVDDESIKRLENRLLKIESQLKSQDTTNSNNNLMLARIREEVDTAANVKKEDRIILTGLKSKTPLPVEARKRDEFLREMATKIFKTLIPDFKGKIVFVNQGKGKTHLVPMMEIKLDTVAHAESIRKSFAEKRAKKSLPNDLDSLFVTNSVNLATRIRIDVMKAIARKLTTKQEQAYVSGFISRPMMHIKKLPFTANSRPLKSFTYIDAVTKFRHLVKYDDLTAAYSRVGNAFGGQLIQNFVVLNDQDHDRFSSGRSEDTSRSSGSGYPSGSADRGKGSSFRGGSSYRGDRGGSSYRGDRGAKRSGEDLSSSSSKSRKQ